jgi:TIR domain
MADIFLSYASVDQTRVSPIIEALQYLGFSVWWDRFITPGKTWSQVIEKELAAAKCVIVIWSFSSVNSDWVDIEASRGKQRGILIPVMIDRGLSLVPLEFSRIQMVWLTEWNHNIYDPEFKKLINAVVALTGDTQKTVALKFGIETENPDNIAEYSSSSYANKIYQIMLNLLWAKDPPRRRTLGFILLAVDVILMAMVVSVFDLNNREPWWEGLFFVISMFIGMIACFLIISAEIAERRNRRGAGWGFQGHLPWLQREIVYWPLRLFVAAYGLILIATCVAILIDSSRQYSLNWKTGGIILALAGQGISLLIPHRWTTRGRIFYIKIFWLSVGVLFLIMNHIRVLLILREKPEGAGILSFLVPAVLFISLQLIGLLTLVLRKRISEGHLSSQSAA